MLGSRVCWQLFLGWALLLGQPAFGDSDAAEESPLAELEEPVPISQEELVPISQEEPVPASEEQEESELEWEEPEKTELTSDEELEDYEKQHREGLKEDLSRPWDFKVDSLKQTVLEHFHKHSKEYYRPFDSANIIYEKAIGTMMYLRITVVETNCTNDLRPKEESDHSYYYRLYHADRNCEPLGDFQKDCHFTWFEDARKPGEPILIEHNCFLLYKRSGRVDYFPEDILEDM